MNNENDFSLAVLIFIKFDYFPRSSVSCRIVNPLVAATNRVLDLLFISIKCNFGTNVIDFENFKKKPAVTRF